MRGFVFVALLAVAISGEARAQDAAAGEKVFGVCKTCHQIGENAKNGVGPVLNGVIGRKAGSVAGYTYSAANKDSGITWDEADLPRVHQGPEGQGSGHENDLCRIEGRAEDQRSGRVPQAVRRGRKEEVGATAPSMAVPGKSPEVSVTTRTPVPRLRAYDGPALLSYGFRPFFCHLC